MLREQPQERLRHTNYFLQDKSDSRNTGLFPVQQEKLAEHIRKRRGHGKPVSTTYIRLKMKQFCLKDSPQNFDPEKNIFGEHWVTNFMDKHHFSVRRATNIKDSSIWERLHKIHNYHWYTQYQMALEDISDVSETEDEDEVFDAKSDGDASDCESSSESEEYSEEEDSEEEDSEEEDSEEES